MPQSVRAILFSIGLAVSLTIVAYFGLPATTFLLFPGFWLAVRTHMPDINGGPFSFHAMFIASIVAYSVSIWLALQLIHAVFSISKRLTRAWIRSRL
jgi:hypothetical protein